MNTFSYLLVFANVMDRFQLWKEFCNRPSEDYAHWRVPIERKYFGLFDIPFIFCWHGLTLSNFNLPKQGVTVHPGVDAQQNFNSQSDAIGDTMNQEQTKSSYILLKL